MADRAIEVCHLLGHRTRRNGDEDQREGGRLWPDPGRTKALVNVIVEFSGPTESMTLTVIVPNDGDEAALQEQGIARAKDFALQFAANRA